MTTIWTTERPTKDGTYWMSLRPEHRYIRETACTLFGVMEPVTLYTNADGDQIILLDRWDDSITEDRGGGLLDGALWAPRETPANPFAKTDPMREYYDREQKLTSDALIKKAIQHLRKRKPKNGRGYVYPLWKRVTDLFGHGSGSAEICRRYGFDPDEQWMPEQECPDCKRLVDPEELRPAPCNYEQDVNGNDTPYVMCRSCRAERNDESAADKRADEAGGSDSVASSPAAAADAAGCVKKGMIQCLVRGL